MYAKHNRFSIRDTTRLRLSATSLLRHVSLTLLLISFHAHAQSVDAPDESAKPNRESDITQDDARQRERGAEEDPLTQRQVERVDRPDEWEDKPSEVELYGSARLHYNAKSGSSGPDPGCLGSPKLDSTWLMIWICS